MVEVSPQTAATPPLGLFGPRSNPDVIPDFQLQDFGKGLLGHGGLERARPEALEFGAQLGTAGFGP